MGFPSESVKVQVLTSTAQVTSSCRTRQNLNVHHRQYLQRSKPQIGPGMVEVGTIFSVFLLAKYMHTVTVKNVALCFLEKFF